MIFPNQYIKRFSMKQFYFCLFLLPLLSATSKPTSSTNTSKPSSFNVCQDINKCELPEPADFVVTSYSTNYFDLQWSAVPDAYAYKLEVIETIPNVIIKTLITRNLHIRVDGLVSGTEYSILISATACEGGFKAW